jgi:hypothetical protein
VDPKASLAWWQVDPHLSHLWATTCPNDPSWRPGEERSAGWFWDPSLELPKAGHSTAVDTSRVPLFPRRVVQPICPEAVRGQVLAPDTVTWQGTRGVVEVSGDALVTGLRVRDDFARRAVLQTYLYPTMRFTVDSIVGVTQTNDTLRGTVVGTFLLHGVGKPVRAGVTAWREAGGLRVLSRFELAVTEMTHEFGMSKFALGLGIGTGIWRTLFVGVDVLMRTEAPAPDN